MAAPDMDVIKEIPGYKVILKAVLKAQIQQLVEQLASHTEEDSIILTASVHDATLSHLGSESGKAFLEDHEDMKAQFLSHCLKYHHRKQQEKEREEREEAMRQAAAAQYAARPTFIPNRSPRHPPPRFMGGRHPLRSPNSRMQPYPIARPVRAAGSMGTPSPMKSPNKLDGQVIKIEPEDNDEGSNQGVSDSKVQGSDIAIPTSVQSPSHSNPPSTPSKSKSESGDKDDDARSESSTSTIPNEPPAEGLSLDSDLSNLISEQSQQQQQGQQGSESGEMDPNVNVKLEALTESELELEITGVEPGRPAVSQDNWDPNVSMGLNFDPTGATGSSGEVSGQGYSGIPDYLFERKMEGMSYQDQLLDVISSPAIRGFPYSMTDHQGESRSVPGILSGRLQTEALMPKDPKPVKTVGNLSVYQCNQCGKCFSRRDFLLRHAIIHTGLRPFECDICHKRFNVRTNLNSHRAKVHNVK